MSVLFNGRRIVHPGGYDAMDASGLTQVSDPISNLPIVVGQSDSGAPGQVRWFTSVEMAENYLVSGEALDALKVMFSPRPEGGGGASRIGVLITNELTRAVLAVGGLRFVSYVYGTFGNNIRVKLENGTLAGTKRLMVRRWDKNLTEVYDNLGASFYIKYNGDEAFAEATITAVDGKATNLEVKVGATEATSVVDLSVPLTGEIATITDLINHLSSIPEYTVYMAGGTLSSDVPVSALVAKKASIKAETLLTVDPALDLISQVTNLSDIIYVEKDPEVAALSNFIDTPLAGGQKGTSPNSWSTAINSLRTVYHDILVILSDKANIHAEATRHVQQMELRNQKQVLFTGGGIGETPAQAKQRAQILNSSRVVLGYPDIYLPGTTEGVRPAYFTGAILAGRVAGLSATEPITFDLFNVLSLGREMVAGDPDIDELIEAGVATLELTRNNTIRLAQGVTTYTGQDNVLYKEISVRRGADAVSEHVRSGLEQLFVGTKGLSMTPSSVTTATIDLLNERGEQGTQDILGFRNIQVSFENTAVRVDYEVAMVEPINFVLVTSHFVPGSTITGAVNSAESEDF